MADTFRIATYNIENLFDRFDDPYGVGDDPWGRFGTNPKSRSKQYDMGYRIRQSGADILALQEIENYGALRDFVQASVGPKFPPRDGIVSQNSNDPRGIDLGLLAAKDFAIGRVISHRFSKFKRADGKSYRFGRDCLQVEIFDKKRTQIVLTAFVCHFKSKYTGIDPIKDPTGYAKAQATNDLKRAAEAAEVIRIVQNTLDPATDRFVIIGDLNDTPDSTALAALTAPGNVLNLTNATDLLAADNPGEDVDKRPRDTHGWTRRGPDGKNITTYAQIDFILCSQSLWALNTGKADVINAPKNQGSDHYISWAEFNMPDAPA